MERRNSHEDPIGRIVLLARSIRGTYRQNAAILTGAREHVKALNIDPPSMVGGARYFCRDQEEICTNWAMRVHELAELAAKHLPTVFQSLHWIDTAGLPWHQQEDFDWDAAEAELREIEASALSGRTIEAIAESPNDKRDAWIYEQCKAGIPYGNIRRDLQKKRNSWDRIYSFNGIKAAAERYARRHGLPRLPRRSSGWHKKTNMREKR
jgi:hypothetical protein